MRGSPKGQEACEAREGRNVSKSHRPRQRYRPPAPRGCLSQLRARKPEAAGDGVGARLVPAKPRCWDTAEPPAKEPRWGGRDRMGTRTLGWGAR